MLNVGKPCISYEEQFAFYLSLAQPLICQLSNKNERSQSLAWIKKLKDETNILQVRIDYLKLLLLVLQSGQLSGPFAEYPDNKPLIPFRRGTNLKKLARDYAENNACSFKQIRFPAVDEGHKTVTVRKKRKKSVQRKTLTCGTQITHNLKEADSSDVCSICGVQTYKEEIEELICKCKTRGTQTKSLVSSIEHCWCFPAKEDHSCKCSSKSTQTAVEQHELLEKFSFNQIMIAFSLVLITLYQLYLIFFTNDCDNYLCNYNAELYPIMKRRLCKMFGKI